MGTTFVKTTTLDASGNYTLANIPAGTYSIGVKGYKWLRTVIVPAVSVVDMQTTSGVNASLQGGDADNSNNLDPADFNILSSAYGTTYDPNDPNNVNSGYDPRADFNCDGTIDTADFNFLAGDFGQAGVVYQITLTGPAATTGIIRLTWSLPSSTTGNAYIASLPLTYTLYRSFGTPAHGSVPYRTNLSDRSFTESTPLPNGTYYYQVVGFSPAHDGQLPAYALSNEIAVTVANSTVTTIPPTITGSDPTYTITGYKQSGQYVGYPSYIATVTNGLLTSFLTYNDSNVAAEYFHQGTAPNYPFQFGEWGPGRQFGDCTQLFAPNGPSLDSNTHTYHTVQHPVVTASNPPTLSAKLTETYDTGQATTILYAPIADTLTVTLMPDGGSNNPLSVAWEIGTAINSSYIRTEQVVAAQPKDEAPEAYDRLHGSGVTHQLPLVYMGAVDDTVKMSGVHDVRYYLTNSAALDIQSINPPGVTQKQFGNFFSTTGGASFRYSTTNWGCSYPAAPVAAVAAFMQFTFAPVTVPGTTVSSTPPLPFHLVALPSNPNDYYSTNVNDSIDTIYPNLKGAGQGMFAKGSPFGNMMPFRVFFDPQATSQVTALNFNLPFKYSITDFRGNNVYVTPGATTGSFSITTTHQTQGNQTSGTVTTGFESVACYYADVLLPMPVDATPNTLTGWFHIKAWVDQGPNGTTNIPDEDDADFGIYNYNTEAPAAGSPAAQPYLYNAGPIDPILADINNHNPIWWQVATAQLLGLRASRILGDSTMPYVPITGSTTMALPLPAPFAQLDTYGNPYNVSGYGSDPNAMQLIVSLEGSNYISKANLFVNAYGNLGQSDPGYHGILSTMNTFHTTAYTGTPIAAWSIGNEPNNSRNGYGGIPGEYITDPVKGLIAGYTLIQSGSMDASGNPIPHAPVLGPNIERIEINNGASYNGSLYRLSWMQDFLNGNNTDPVNPYLGGGAYVDGISVHSYTGDNRSWEEHGTAESLAYLRYILDNDFSTTQPTNAHGKPIWITEHGWNWQFTADTPLLQADYIVRSYVLAAAQNIMPGHYAYFQPIYLENGDGTDAIWEGAPYRAGMAYRILAEQTQGLCAYNQSTVNGQNLNDLLPTYPTGVTFPTHRYVHAIAYTDMTDLASNPTYVAKNPVVIVWGNDFLDPQRTTGPTIANLGYTDDDQPGQQVTITFTTNSQFDYAVDMMGNPIALAQPIHNGSHYTYTLPVTGSPVYFHLTQDDLNVNSLTSGSNANSGDWPVLAHETNYALSTNGGTVKIYDANSTNVNSAMLPTDNGIGFTPLSTIPHVGFSSPANDLNGAIFATGDATILNDGFWQYDDTNTFASIDRVLSTPANPVYANLGVWVSGLSYKSRPAIDPCFVVAEVDFPTSHNIDTIVAVCPSVASGTLCGIRDYDIQVYQTGLPTGTVTANLQTGGPITFPAWVTVKSVTGNTTEWVLHAHLAAPIPASAVRILIKDINDGGFYEDKAPLPNTTPTGQYGSSLRAMLYELEAYGTN